MSSENELKELKLIGCDKRGTVRRRDWLNFFLALRTMQKLESLDLSGNDFSDVEVIAELSKAVSALPNLDMLSLKR